MADAVIVRDNGFNRDDTVGPIVPVCGTAPANAMAIDLAPDADVAALAMQVQQFHLIRIDFPTSGDGRGFTLARRLRNLGYRGRLRARGHVLADQYAMARRSGFDEVEIDATLAARQREPHWLARADWRSGDYRARLAAPAS